MARQASIFALFLFWHILIPNHRPLLNQTKESNEFSTIKYTSIDRSTLVLLLSAVRRLCCLDGRSVDFSTLVTALFRNSYWTQWWPAHEIRRRSDDTKSLSYSFSSLAPWPVDLARSRCLFSLPQFVKQLLTKPRKQNQTHFLLPFLPEISCFRQLRSKANLFLSFYLFDSLTLMSRTGGL